MNEELDRVKLLRAGGGVHRYHTARTLRGQTNADHSWGVAMLVLAIEPDASALLLAKALTHDVPEFITGDMPATVKRAEPRMAVLFDELEAQIQLDLDIEYWVNEHEETLLRWCDTAELILWCFEEIKLGNTYAKRIALNGLNYLGSFKSPNERAAILHRQLSEEATLLTEGVHEYV